MDATQAIAANKIPPERAEFFFEKPVAAVPTEFVAADANDRPAPGQDAYQHLGGSLGCHCSGWLQGDENYMHGTPEGVFASLYLSSSDQLHQIMHGLREMTKLQGQEWAIRMLRTLERAERDRRGE